MTRETKVPSIPAVTKDNVVEVLQAIKDTLEVREGKRGDELDQMATLRDLVALELVNTGGSVDRSGAGGTGTLPVVPPSWTGNYNPTTDLTTPPTPTNLIAVPGFTNVNLFWDNATYKNHAYTEVWRSETDVLGSAVLVGTTSAYSFQDAVVEGRVYYYWVRFVSQANVTGAYNLTSGTRAQTELNPERLINLLSGQITESELYKDLGARINLIDGPANLPNSVAYRMKEQDDNFRALIDEERVVRVTDTESLARKIETVSSEMNGNTASVQVVSESLNGIQAKYTVKIDNNGYVSGYGLISTANNAAPTSEFAVRADRFYIASPSGPGIAPAAPFIVQTTQTTINGETVPVGVYIDTAFIKKGTITSAYIGSLDAGKITTGTLSVALGGSAAFFTNQAVTKVVNGQTVAKPSSDFSATWDATAGFYLGEQGGTYKFYVGNGSTQGVSWNGTNLTVTGTINAIAGSFRNITVYDANNNVILSSGGVPVSAVTGLGTLATQNSVDYSNVSGTKPPSDATRNVIYRQASAPTSGMSGGDIWFNTSTFAVYYYSLITGWTLAGDVTSQNQAASIINQGALATASSVFVGSNVRFSDGTMMNTGDFVNRLSRIGSGNISTFIDGAAITDAYIGNLNASKITAGTIAADRLDATVINAKVTNIDAAVIQTGTFGTLRIGTNAVSIPLSVYSGGPTSISTSYATIATLSIDRSSGAGGAVPMVGIFSYTHQNTGPSFFNDAHTVEVRVIRTADGAQVFWGSYSASGGWTTPYSASFRDTYSGVTSYQLQVKVATGAANAYYSTLTLIETRR